MKSIKLMPLWNRLAASLGRHGGGGRSPMAAKTDSKGPSNGLARGKRGDGSPLAILSGPQRVMMMMMPMTRLLRAPRGALPASFGLFRGFGRAQEATSWPPAYGNELREAFVSAAWSAPARLREGSPPHGLAFALARRLTARCLGQVRRAHRVHVPGGPRPQRRARPERAAPRPGPPGEPGARQGARVRDVRARRLCRVGAVGAAHVCRACGRAGVRASRLRVPQGACGGCVICGCACAFAGAAALSAHPVAAQDCRGHEGPFRERRGVRVGFCLHR